ncbi:MAG: hypothetical protein EAZ25_05700 [Oscillatoriales cyanobacterium]|uniref:hypothetical protein n=1 Tax=unclassified Microcoleus TaxID=2642155 RepID=UPI001DC0B976|nr:MULTISPECIES: hypothetical protein [unclassified Microcoleus]MCC3635420.1 hypothetical protein [Microcoleus sp. PH2017_37_MFU_D_B]TAG67885.1 MAG: hypothetical protein EAZ25_05700 [Oscillatoriales cyanobacterium]
MIANVSFGKGVSDEVNCTFFTGMQDDTERQFLRKAVAQARTIEGKAINFSDKFGHLREIQYSRSNCRQCSIDELNF